MMMECMALPLQKLKQDGRSICKVTMPITLDQHGNWRRNTAVASESFYTITNTTHFFSRSSSMGTPFYFASVSPDIWIGDDGTLDTVVKFNRNGETETHRYDSEYRFSFSNDDEFLREVYRELK